MGYKAAVQILKEADDLKIKLAQKTDLLIDSQAWTDQQKLQTIYHQALVSDLEYALDKKVEQDLWNVAFKSYITALQELIRDKKNAKRSDYQALLTWCLEAASGFYITLLQELCNVFDIDLPFRRRGNIYGQTNAIANDSGHLPQSSSCLYICQYCLVHLGDIARYRNQRKQAENFYKQAILVSPNSGHPYNQLALLEASQGDKLSTVFYYIRGIAVKNPFPASTTNLLSTLTSTMDKESPFEKIRTKMTVHEFIQIFLCTHTFLHTATDLTQAKFGVDSLNTTMTALVATQSFTADKLIKITAINLYALQHVTSSGKIDDNDQLTDDEQTVREYVLDLLAGSLSAFLVPVHTLKSGDSLWDYYALPAVKLLIYWIQNEPEVLNEIVFSNRLQIWPSLCKLLNNAQQYLKDFDYSKYHSVPISEDKMLQGFQPLLKSFKQLDFKLDVLDDNDDNVKKNTEKLIRAKRLVDFGDYLTELNVNNTKLILKFKDEQDKITFVPGCMQPDPTNDLLEEIKSFNIGDGATTTTYSNQKATEKRGGILKPQGSLEKSREERELLSLNSGGESRNNPPINCDQINNTTSMVGFNPSASSTTVNNKVESSIKMKRSKQNVALQSIYKKLEENKQVKFNVETVEKPDKLMMSENKKQSNNIPSSTLSSSNTQFLRNQSFNNTNHPPPFPLVPSNNNSNQDYLNTLRNISHDQTNNFSKFPKPDLQKQNTIPSHAIIHPNSNNNMSYPNFNTTQSMMFNANINNKTAASTTILYDPVQQQNPFISTVQAPPPPPQQRVLPPPSYQNNVPSFPPPPPNPTTNYNVMKMDEPPSPAGSASGGWWSNNSNNTGNNNYQMPPPPLDNFQLNYQYNHNAMPPPPQSYLHPQNMEYNSSKLQQQNHHHQAAAASGDVFNSPWHKFGRTTTTTAANFIRNDSTANNNSYNNDNNSSNSMSTMRQAMLLKEANNMTHDNFMQNSPGYSLFNANSWTPNLVSQLRSNNNNNKSLQDTNSTTNSPLTHHLPQQSLFTTGQGPQSLAQLLEQQQSQKNDP